MKTLAMAVVGLVGFGAAGAAMAQTCPGTALSPPWSTRTALSGGTAASVAGGLDSSPCKLNVSISSATTSIATVTDNTPSNETRYRFQFIFDASGFGNFGTTDSVVIFNGNAASPNPAGANRRQIVTLALSPGPAGAKRLTITASQGNSSPFRTSVTTGDLLAGVNRIEVDLTVGSGAGGSLKYWLNAAAGTTEPAATGSLTSLNNIGWVGVNSAALGLSGGSPSFRSAHADQIFSIDTFDSRRQTYIGF